MAVVLGVPANPISNCSPPMRARVRSLRGLPRILVVFSTDRATDITGFSGSREDRQREPNRGEWQGDNHPSPGYLNFTCMHNSRLTMSTAALRRETSERIGISPSVCLPLRHSPLGATRDLALLDQSLQHFIGVTRKSNHLNTLLVSLLSPITSTLYWGHS